MVVHSMKLLITHLLNFALPLDGQNAGMIEDLVVLLIGAFGFLSVHLALSVLEQLLPFREMESTTNLSMLESKDTNVLQKDLSSNPPHTQNLGGLMLGQELALMLGFI